MDTNCSYRPSISLGKDIDIGLSKASYVAKSDDCVSSDKFAVTSKPTVTANPVTSVYAKLLWIIATESYFVNLFPRYMMIATHSNHQYKNSEITSMLFHIKELLNYIGILSILKNDAGREASQKESPFCVVDDIYSSFYKYKLNLEELLVVANELQQLQDKVTACNESNNRNLFIVTVISWIFLSCNINLLGKWLKSNLPDTTFTKLGAGINVNNGYNSMYYGCRGYFDNLICMDQDMFHMYKNAAAAPLLQKVALQRHRIRAVGSQTGLCINGVPRKSFMVRLHEIILKLRVIVGMESHKDINETKDDCFNNEDQDLQDIDETKDDCSNNEDQDLQDIDETEDDCSNNNEEQDLANDNNKMLMIDKDDGWILV